MTIGYEEMKKLDKLIPITSDIVGVSEYKILSKYRTYEPVTSRRIIGYILTHYNGWTLAKAAKALKRKDHTTVINNNTKHVHDYQTNYRGYRNLFNLVLNQYTKDGGLEIDDRTKRIMEKIDRIEKDLAELKKISLGDE